MLIVFSKKTISPNFISEEYLRTIYVSCLDILNEGKILEKNWNKITRKLPEIDDNKYQKNDTREEQINKLETILEKLFNKKGVKKTISNFLGAYLASQIAPGSLEYIDLLYSYTNRYPSIIMWYSLCAGLYNKPDIYNYSKGIGWRVLRDLLKNDIIGNRPNGDISVDELEMLLLAEKPIEKILTDSHNYITVEIIPDVYTVLIWPKIHDKEQQKQKEYELPQVESRDSLKQLGDTLIDAINLYNNYIYNLENKSEKKKER